MDSVKPILEKRKQLGLTLWKPIPDQFLEQQPFRDLGLGAKLFIDH